MAKINMNQVLLELSAAEPILIDEALQAIESASFLPAVTEMKKNFDKDPVTQEIDGGIYAKNISDTLPSSSHPQMNLFSFIGFSDGDDPLEPIREALDPSSENGPKLVYIRGSGKDRLNFRFRVYAPNKEAIYDNTPFPDRESDYMTGLSWAERIEIGGIYGVTRFLNKLGKGESGGGLQVKNRSLRSGSFKTRRYLSKIFEEFISSLK